MNNEPSKKEIRKIIPFIIASIRIKYSLSNQDSERHEMKTTKHSERN
jgi:hypothetical protein